MKTSISILLLIFLGTIRPAFAQQEVDVYPNPFQDSVFLVTAPSCGDSIQLVLYDMNGRELLNPQGFQTIKPDTIPYQLKLKSGIYLLRLKQNKEESTHKIVSNGDTMTNSIINLVLSNKNLNCLKNPFEIFPNPSSDGLFKIRQPNLALSYKITVHDAAGNLISQETLENRSSASYPLDLSDESDGVYFLQMESQQGKEIFRVVVEREK